MQHRVARQGESFSDVLVKKWEKRGGKNPFYLNESAGEQPFDAFFIGDIDHRGSREAVVLRSRVFPVAVAHVGMATLDSTRAGKLESLFCSGVGFHFRHDRIFLRRRR